MTMTDTPEGTPKSKEIPQSDLSKYVTSDAQVQLNVLTPAIIEKVELRESMNPPKKDSQGKEYATVFLAFKFKLDPPIENLSECVSNFSIRRYDENGLNRLWFGTEKSGTRKLMDLIQNSLGVNKDASIVEILNVLQGKKVSLKSEQVHDPNKNEQVWKVFIKAFRL